MQNILAFVLLLFFLSLPSATMKAYEDEPCHVNFLPDELFFGIIAQVSDKISHIVTLYCVCENWHRLLGTEDFWKAIYIFKYGHERKIDFSRTFKEQMLAGSLIFHTQINCKIDDYSSPFPISIGLARIVYTQWKEQTADWILAIDQIADDLITLLEQKPRVLCPRIGLYFGGHKIGKSVERFFELARHADVLVILTTGRGGAAYSKIMDTGEDIHERFPHVIWVTVHDASRKLHEWANRGDLVDIATAHVPDTLFDNLILGHLAFHLRSLRPGLRADQIRDLILKSADNVDASTGLAYDIPLVNGAAAERAVREFQITLGKSDGASFVDEIDEDTSGP